MLYQVISNDSFVPSTLQPGVFLHCLRVPMSSPRVPFVETLKGHRRYAAVTLSTRCAEAFDSVPYSAFYRICTAP